MLGEVSTAITSPRRAERASPAASARACCITSSSTSAAATVRRKARSVKPCTKSCTHAVAGGAFARQGASRAGSAALSLANR
jgi:hypothetical protein